MYYKSAGMQLGYNESHGKGESDTVPNDKDKRSFSNLITSNSSNSSKSLEFPDSLNPLAPSGPVGSMDPSGYAATQMASPLLNSDLNFDNDDEIMAIEALGQLKNSTAPASPMMIDDEHDNANDANDANDVNDVNDANDKDADSRMTDDNNYARDGTKNTDNIYNTDNAGDVGDDYDDYVDDSDGDDEQYYDTSDVNPLFSEKSSKRAKLFRKMKNHPFYHTAVRAYKSNKPAIKKGVEMVERATLPMVTIIGQTSSEWKRKRRLSKTSEMFPEDLGLSQKMKRRELQLPSISEALGLGGNKNLNDFTLRMSISSKGRLKACLDLLILANRHISAKVAYLQNAIAKEQERNENAKEIFYDAKQEIEEDEAVKKIQEDIVNTIRKVISVISKFAGSSLPEPERSRVRETLLKLPTKWLTQTKTEANTLLNYNTNRNVLILAKLSLEAVGSVMSIFDETLANAECWVEKKQGEQLAKQAILNSTIERQKIINEED